MFTVEREISSIETANINKETLDAMKQAQQAMVGIHGGLTIDKVDQTMEGLRDQHAISEEIADALTQGSIGEPISDGELEAELEELQQEQLDNKMLETGNVPVDHIPNMPNVVAGKRELFRATAVETCGFADRPIVKGNPVQEDDEEEELRKLQAEMAM